MSRNIYQAGLQNAGSYQVAGKPFCLGNIDASSANVQIKFPSVTRWVVVSNSGNSTINIGFSNAGLNNTNFFQLPSGKSTDRLELKLTELYVRGGAAGDVSVVAGLTYIPKERINNVQISPSGSNWSGSVGIG